MNAPTAAVLITVALIAFAAWVTAAGLRYAASLGAEEPEPEPEPELLPLRVGGVYLTRAGETLACFDVTEGRAFFSNRFGGVDEFSASTGRWSPYGGPSQWDIVKRIK